MVPVVSISERVAKYKEEGSDTAVIDNHEVKEKQETEAGHERGPDSETISSPCERERETFSK